LISTQPFYGQGTVLKPRPLFALFRGIEFHRSGVNAAIINYGGQKDQYSVEHVYPKSLVDKPGQWAADLKAWKVKPADYAELVHSIGNLTLMTGEMNKWLGAKPFSEKKMCLAGSGIDKAHEASIPTMPHLRVNDFLRNASTWKPSDIRRRSRDIANHIVRQWTSRPEHILD